MVRTGVLSSLAEVVGGGGGEGVICTVIERFVPPVAQLRVSGNSSDIRRKCSQTLSPAWVSTLVDS